MRSLQIIFQSDLKRRFIEHNDRTFHSILPASALFLSFSPSRSHIFSSSSIMFTVLVIVCVCIPYHRQTNHFKLELFGMMGVCVCARVCINKKFRFIFDRINHFLFMKSVVFFVYFRFYLWKSVLFLLLLTSILCDTIRLHSKLLSLSSFFSLCASNSYKIERSFLTYSYSFWYFSAQV